MAAKQNPSRMLVLLPLLFLVGKLDWENQNILFAARCSFFTCQVVQLLIALWIKRTIESKKDLRTIYVPNAPENPFASSSSSDDPSSKNLKKTTYHAHEMMKVSEFVRQCGIGAAISSFIHFKVGVNQVLVIQSVMIPLNLFENALVKAYVMGKSKNNDDRIWDELLEGEEKDGAAAASGATATITTKSSSSSSSSYPKDPKEAITRFWDDAEKGDSTALYKAIQSDPNTKNQDGWTALMVAVGSPMDTTEFIVDFCTKLKTNVKTKDNDGWTALHWAAFHGRPEAAETLLGCLDVNTIEHLLAEKDLEDKTALDIAQSEKNDQVVLILKSFASKDGKPKTTTTGGLRQRTVDGEIGDVD